MFLLQNQVQLFGQELYSYGDWKIFFCLFYFLSVTNFLVYRRWLDKLKALHFGAFGFIFIFVFVSTLTIALQLDQATMYWSLCFFIVFLFILDYIELNIFYIFGSKLTSEFVLVFLGTNLRESKQFFASYFNPDLQMYILLVLALPFFVFIFPSV